MQHDHKHRSVHQDPAGLQPAGRSDSAFVVDLLLRSRCRHGRRGAHCLRQPGPDRSERFGLQVRLGPHVGPGNPAHVGRGLRLSRDGGARPDHRCHHGPRGLRRRLPPPARTVPTQQPRPVATAVQQVDVRRQPLNQVKRECFMHSSLSLV